MREKIYREMPACESDEREDPLCDTCVESDERED